MKSSKQTSSAVLEQAEEDRHITMSNRLTRSAHGLNLSEKRLISLGLAGTDSMPNQAAVLASTNSGWKTRVSALDYAKAFDLDPATAYAQLQDACKKLFDRHVHYETENFRGKIIKHDIRWVSSATYAEGDGYVELNFSPEIAPHLLGLQKHFTSYKLNHASALNTVYAWRLYEVLKSWQSTGLYTTSIEDFWEVMDAPPSLRKDFKALRTRVIEPATTAICTKTPLSVQWVPVKSGSRRVTGLEFVIKSDAPPDADLF